MLSDRGLQLGKYLDAKAKSEVNIPTVRSRSAKSLDDTSGIIQHPALFQQLKEWRNSKAVEMHLPHYMIVPQKTMVNLATFMPQSLQALKSVKGMGTKKTEKFGEEILEIIISFCKKENIEPSSEVFSEKKPPKKIKEDTKKTSFDLFQEGKGVSQIAEERRLSITTIEGHLAHYVYTGDIPINKFVSQEMTDLIMSHFEGSDELRIGPVKAALGEKVSWSDIKFVISHIMFLRRSKND